VQDYLTKPALTGGMDHEYAEILDPETRLETPEESPETETVSKTEPECSVCSEPGPDLSLQLLAFINIILKKVCSYKHQS
jgi:hypothetical protein